MDEPRTFHVVVFRGERYWVAQCLEVNIAAQAPTLDELGERFVKTMKAEVTHSAERGVEPFSALPPAPKRYWDMWPHQESTQDPEPVFGHRESLWNLSLGLGGARAAVAFA